MSKTNKAAPAAPKETRDLRFSIRPSVHKDVSTLRAKTDLTNEELLTDMVKVYKANPDQWISAKAATRTKAKK